MINNIKLIFLICFYILLIAITLNAEIVFEADSDVFINRKHNFLNTDQYFLFRKDNISMQAKKLFISYVSLDNIDVNINNNNYDNFRKIIAMHHVIIKNSKNDALLKGEKYIFDVPKNIMILTSKPHATTYEDGRYKIIANDRFEYHNKKHLIVIRGEPVIKVKSQSSNDIIYNIKADLFYAQLTDEDKFRYIEGLKPITIKTLNNETITCDSVYLDNKNQLLYLKENIVIIGSDGQSKTKGCQIIIDMLTDEKTILPCDNNEPLEAQIYEQ